jgi:Beta-ketoacyl synthase, N-terminal domain
VVVDQSDHVEAVRDDPGIGEVLADDRAIHGRQVHTDHTQGGRYPQAETLDQYWENLKTGTDSIQEIPPERWPIDGFYHSDFEEARAQGKSYSKWGGFLDGFAEFDPLFFGISPREAMEIDPQERLFLQICWDLLESAGYTREILAARHQGRVGAQFRARHAGARKLEPVACWSF